MGSPIPIHTPRREGATSTANHVKSQMVLADLPELFKTLGKQQRAVHQAINEQTGILKNQLTTHINERDWVARLHDRVDAVAIEGRVTNVLLAELVSIHKSITNDTQQDSEAIRADAYNRVLNGE